MAGSGPGQAGVGRERGHGSAKTLVSIVMPAYNEEANIEQTVRASARALHDAGLAGEIVVADDGSTDSTGKILARLSSELSGLVVVRHDANRGYGAALRSAIAASSGEQIVTIDSDGQFDIGELPSLVGEGLNGTAVVTGYRRKKQDTFFRVFANRGLNLFITALFGLRLNDINCAFRLYRADALRSISIESSGYQAPSEIMIKLANMGCAFRQVGVSHLPRMGGQSALRPLKTMAQMSAFLVYLKMKVLLYKRGLLNSL